MKLFEYRVDLNKLKVSEADEKVFAKDDQKTLFENILNHALGQRFENRMSGKDGRILARILGKLDILAAKELLELEEAEFDMIEKSFTGDEVRFAPVQYRYISLLVQNIESAKLKG